MSQVRIGRRAVVLWTAGVVIVLLIAGCGDSKKLKSLEQENQILNQRVAELETQLQQAQAAAYTPPPTAYSAPAVQAPVVQTEYLVVRGDTLWSIAKRQLGNGARYKEILALNPQISQNQPLKIGTRLLLPSK